MTSFKRSYYGPFFWVAVVSFIVPLAVAARAFQEVRVTTKPSPRPDASRVDQALWDYLLKTYVENGLIDYDGMARDYLFRTYLRQLAEADPTKLTEQADRLALLCNAYNAFVMNGVITHKIRTSVMDYKPDGVEFFAIEEHIFAGYTMSLNYIEHELIRKQFKEPRIHVALVCAARSCPAIRAEAYVGNRLASQLEDQAVQFANNPRYVTLDTTNQTLQLSPLLNWYGDDWQQVGGYLPWLRQRVKEPSLQQAIDAATRGELQVTFAKYDWALNSQADPEAPAESTARKTVDFGSGSIPNR